jgi:hypothetical protein
MRSAPQKTITLKKATAPRARPIIDPTTNSGMAANDCTSENRAGESRPSSMSASSVS